MTQQVLQFKVTLHHFRPPIWRRFQVTNDLSFLRFHDVLQVVMGWQDGHLHEFDLGNWHITDAETLTSAGLSGEDERKVRLSKHLTQAGQKFTYTYDFGDTWEHEVLLEKILPVEAGVHYPRCLKGKRACPPEDCGGVWGYAALLKAMADPRHPEYEDYMGWLGERIDPEAFDLALVNKELAAR